MAAELQQHVFAQLDRLAGPAGRFALGYSGGGDSHALLLLATDWAKLRGRDLTALIVDHGLRPESADEAALALERAEAAGIPAEVLSWTGEKPQQGIQAAARTARHTLLATACRRLGIAHLLLAHTLDDQAETVWMRLVAGGGWRSLAGMRERSASPVWPQGRGLELIRPVLQVRRAALRQYLDDADSDWIEDPSNLDRRYTRIRIREHLASMEAQGFDPARLAHWAAGLAGIDRAEAEAAGRLALDALKLEPWGAARIERERYARSLPAVRLRLLDALVHALALPGPAPARRHLQRLDQALIGGERVTAARLMGLRWKSRSWLLRDPGSVLGRADLTQDTPGTHTPGNRLAPQAHPDGTATAPPWHPISAQITLESGLEDAIISPLGRDYAGLEERSLLERIPGIARPALLAVRHCNRIIALPGLLGDERVGFDDWVPERFVTRLFAVTPPAWFDSEKVKAAPAETLSP
ncbi:tRNA lysidine(34) synthetase TilS [Maricaulis sp.]|uniref:tRNA lysidine(34) synthetase TilS n=1 Tax=Maricaulis sp. TaxID=1486257 RepID=UPI002638A09C|nr:tRNA lysidine(34) synthetase TilS [Maricaulis sp.]